VKKPVTVPAMENVLRHAFATFAAAAGSSSFDLAAS
jgi:hypothetical protein